MSKDNSYLTRLNKASMRDDWAGIVSNGQKIGKEDAGQWVFIRISYAATQINKHDLALEYANKAIALGVTPKSISRLVAANFFAGKPQAGIEAWEKYKININLDDCEPTVIANLIYGYIAMDRKEGAVDLLPFVDSNKNKELLELMYFNAACVCSLTDEVERGLNYLWRAIKNGYSRKKAEKDSELQNILDHPAAAYILKSKKGLLRDHVALGCKEDSLDIRITDKTILVINYDTNLEYSGEKIDYKNNYDAIRAYSQKIEALESNGWTTIKSPSIEIIKTAFKSILSSLLKRQNNAQFGVLLCEWDYADEDYERNYWFAAFKHKDEKAYKMRHRYAEMISGDDVLVEQVTTSLPIFDHEIFREIAESLAVEKSFEKLKKEKPFFFVLQEHDSRHECLVEIPLDYNFDAFLERWNPDIPNAVEDALRYLVKLDQLPGPDGISSDFIDRLGEQIIARKHFPYIKKMIKRESPYFQEAGVELAIAAVRDCKVYSEFSVSINSLLRREMLDDWVAKAIIDFVGSIPVNEEASEILVLLEGLAKYAYGDKPAEQAPFSRNIIMRTMGIWPQFDAKAFLEQEVLSGNETQRTRVILPFMEGFYKTRGMSGTIVVIQENNKKFERMLRPKK